jgi:hypothetical protein
MYKVKNLEIFYLFSFDFNIIFINKENNINKYIYIKLIYLLLLFTFRIHFLKKYSLRKILPERLRILQ